MDFTQLVTPAAASGTATATAPNKPAGEMPAGEFLALIQAGLQQARETAQSGSLPTQSEQNLQNAQTVCELVEPPTVAADVSAETELSEAEAASVTQLPVAQTLPALWEALFRQQLEPEAAEDSAEAVPAETGPVPEDTAIPPYSWSAAPAQPSPPITPTPGFVPVDPQTISELPQPPQPEAAETAADSLSSGTPAQTQNAQGIKLPVQLPEPQSLQLSQSWLDQLQALSGKSLTYQTMQTLQSTDLLINEQSAAAKGMNASAPVSAEAAPLSPESFSAQGFDLSGRDAHSQSYSANGERLEFSAPADASSKTQASAQAQTSELADRVALVRQLSDRIQLLHHARQRSIQITLNPASLGKVSLRLQQDAQQMQLHILTELPMAKELLESQIQQLRHQFQQQGLNLQQITVEVNPEHQAFQESSSGQQQQPGQGSERHGPEFSLMGALADAEAPESSQLTVNPFTDGNAVNTLA